MVLVEADPGGERKVGADAHKHASPVPVVNVKVVLNDPAICDLKMPPVRDVVADGSHDARRLARFEGDDDGVGLGSVKIRVNKIVATTFRRIYDWDVAFCSAFLHPGLKLVGNVAQGLPCHRI